MLTAKSSPFLSRILPLGESSIFSPAICSLASLAKAVPRIICSQNKRVTIPTIKNKINTPIMPVRFLLSFKSNLFCEIIFASPAG